MKQQYIQVFKNKNFMKLFIADIISRFGDSLDAIVMTIIVYSITQSASWSALIFAVNKLPTIFIQPLAGAYIEKKNKSISSYVISYKEIISKTYDTLSKC